MFLQKYSKHARVTRLSPSLSINHMTPLSVLIHTSRAHQNEPRGKNEEEKKKKKNLWFT